MLLDFTTTQKILKSLSQPSHVCCVDGVGMNRSVLWPRRHHVRRLTNRKWINCRLYHWCNLCFLVCFRPVTENVSCLTRWLLSIGVILPILFDRCHCYLPDCEKMACVLYSQPFGLCAPCNYPPYNMYASCVSHHLAYMLHLFVYIWQFTICNAKSQVVTGLQFWLLI